MKIIDIAVTIHGTIGFELSYLGKPVLCSDKSSYTEFNFTINSKSRVDYVKKSDQIGGIILIKKELL